MGMEMRERPENLRKEKPRQEKPVLPEEIRQAAEANKALAEEGKALRDQIHSTLRSLREAGVTLDDATKATLRDYHQSIRAIHEELRDTHGAIRKIIEENREGITAGDEDIIAQVVAQIQPIQQLRNEKGIAINAILTDMLEFVTQIQ